MKKSSSVFHALWLLILGLWIGTNVASGLFAAPAVFAFVEAKTITSDIAGSIAGAVFARQSTFGLVVVPLLLIGGAIFLARRPSSRREQATVALLALCMILLFVERFHISPQVQSLREQLKSQFGSIAAAPKDDPLRSRFALLHGLSMLRALGEMICGTAAFILGALRSPS